MKRTPTPLLLAGALLLSAATASAQTTFKLGVRGGLNRALTTVAPGNNNSLSGPNTYERSAEKNAIYAWQAGLVLEAAFGKFAVQPALVFSQKGEKLNASVYYNGGGNGYDASTNSTNRYNWLELPVNFVYTMHGDHGLQIFAGPYVAMGVGGRQTGTNYYAAPNISYAPYEFDDKITYGSSNRHFDAGVNFGFGYRQGPVQVQASFGLGFINLHRNYRSIDPTFYSPTYLYSNEAYNRVAQLTGTYFFAL